MALYVKTDIPEVVLIEPAIFKDHRGHFFESYNKAEFDRNVAPVTFIQDNEAKSGYGVLRGLHYQLPPFAQAKLVRVIHGKVLDVAVDLRKDSPTYKKVVSVILSEQNKKQLFIPAGFAHGYVVLSKEAVFAYKVDNVYSPQSERGLRFDDPELNIDWHVNKNDIRVSEKDMVLPYLADATDLF